MYFLRPASYLNRSLADILCAFVLALRAVENYIPTFSFYVVQDHTLVLSYPRIATSYYRTPRLILVLSISQYFASSLAATNI